jgi:hypothetical protein
MCTLSFLRLSQGYSLMMNRDESPARPHPEDIRQATVLGAGDKPLRVAYPVDPLSSGTWVGANDHGVALALMNQFPAGYTAPAAPVSRGRLIPEALRAQTAITALERVAALDLKQTAPFLLVGMDEDSEPLSLGWDGKRLERRMYADGALQLASSAYKAGEVLPSREAQFDLALKSMEGANAAQVLARQEAYHLSEEPEPGPLAVWTTRPDARTVSFTHLLVLPKQVTLRYLDREAKDAGEGPVEIKLAR